VSHPPPRPTYAASQTMGRPLARLEPSRGINRIHTLSSRHGSGHRDGGPGRAGEREQRRDGPCVKVLFVRERRLGEARSPLRQQR
jgi:hypothetical protein